MARYEKDEKETRGNDKGNYSKGKNKRRKPRKGGNRRDDYRKSERDDTNTYDPNPNHPDWYNRFGDLTNAAGNINFLNKAGNSIDFYGIPEGDSIPGICVIDMCPAVGSNYLGEKASWPYNSPINVNARRLYDRINYKNSRNWSYDASDLMLYVVAVESAVAFHSSLKRVYGLLNGFSATNRYIPDAMIKALGFDADNLRKNMARFKYFINRFALDMSALIIPKGMSLFDRHIYLTSSIFADTQLSKAQFYAYNFSKYFVFYENAKLKASDEHVVGGMCALQPIKDSQSLIQISDIEEFGMTMVEHLINSQDINNMSTDILKAIENNYYTWDMLDENYVAQITLDPSALIQIHNTIAMGTVMAPTMTWDLETRTWSPSIEEGIIYQNDAKDGLYSYYVQQALTTDVTGLGTTMPKIPNEETLLLDTPIENPSSLDIISMTRNMPLVVPHAESGGTWAGKFDVISCGSEIPERMRFYYFNKTQGLVEISDITTWYLMSPGNTANARTIISQFGFSYDVLRAVSKFDYHPHMYISIKYDMDHTSTAIDNDWHIGDLYNYTTLRKEDVVRLHETALISEFFIE